MGNYSYYALYKPFGMLSQFSASGDRETLAGLGAFPSNVYPIGRLDADSEGLLLLTDDPSMNYKLLDPSHGHQRTYLVQVEGAIDDAACRRLEAGVRISVNGKSYTANAEEARLVAPPEWLAARNPPVRFRKTVPDSWCELVLTEGKNRQVRKMTATAGFPTLRLIRIAIEDMDLRGMKPRDVKTVPLSDWRRLLKLA